MKVSIAITSEHIQRLKGTTPSDALIELIWNSVDAAATKIDLIINKNPLGGIDSITLQDNGDGIEIFDIKKTFGTLGQSQKNNLTSNSRGKSLHGSLGEGRFKAYSLGNKIEWLTTTDGVKYHKISGEYGHANAFEVTEIDKVNFKKGTLFSAYNGFENKITISEKDLLAKISAIFAPVLMADEGVSITIDGKKIDPRESIYTEIEGELKNHQAKYKIIVWKNGKTEDGFWCTKGFAVKQSFDIDQIFTGKPFSLFIESPKVNKAVKDGTIEAHEMTELNDIKINVLDILRKELSRLEKLRVAETIETLKGSDLYPFKGEPAGEIEKIERKVFDVCVTKVVQAIPNFASGSKEKQKIAYHLLRTSIESSPNSVQHIFEDILKLPETEIKQLSKILKKYSVAGLIQLAKLVADRRESIAAIEKLVFDTELKRHVLERKHLHKIIEKETWIFGEEFSLGTSDKSLSAVVESHKKLLNIKEDNVSFESSSGATAKETIPDLVLARQYRIGAADKYHHLVIELKRPSVKIGKEEKMQIESYAGEVAEDSRFDKQKTKWTFIVVSSEIDPKVSKLFVNDDGLIAGQQDGNFSVYIKSWSSILQAAKGRMQHLWDKAQLEQPEDDGVQYLNEQYSDIFNDLKARKAEAVSKPLLNEKKKTSAKKK